jgi:N-methylhydantoinase B
MPQSRFSPVDLQILWLDLVAIMDQSVTLLRQSAFSNTVREAGDCQVGLLDTQGRLLVQSTVGMHSFAFTFQETCRQARAHFESLHDGDVVMTNDPWLGTGHLNDLNLLTPLFRNGRLIGYVATAAHADDIGGSTSPDTTQDVAAEGIMLPMLKFFEGGHQNRMVLDILLANVRAPQELHGDLNAQIAAGRSVIARIHALLDDYHLSDIDELGSAILGQSERLVRQSIKQSLHDGDTFTAELETDGFVTPALLKLSITVRGTDLVFDYTGSSPETNRGINCPYQYVCAYTAFGAKCLLDPDTPNNAGFFAPMRVIAPEGCIFNPRRGMPVRLRSRTGLYIPSLIYQALAPALPDRIIADYQIPWSQRFYWNDANGRNVTSIVISGGLGARRNNDGLSTLAFPSPVGNTPVELTEYDAPILVVMKKLWPNSGGAGAYRGGLGQRVVCRWMANNGTMVTQAERTVCAPRGLMGGGDAPTARTLVNGTQIPGKTRVDLHEGDVIDTYSPGGGGYGPPAQRDPALVARDLAEGYAQEREHTTYSGNDD